MDNEKKNKMELLKRKARRNNLLKELSNIVNVSNESFLSLHENGLFCKTVYEKIETIQNKVKIKGEDLKQNIELSKENVEKIIKNCSFKESFVRVLFFREQEIEAVKININEVKSNIMEIMQISRFLDGYGDFVLVECNLNYGITVERTEYFYEFCIWGFC